MPRIYAKTLVVVVSVVTAAIPLALYYLVVGRVPGMTPAEAEARLAEPDSSYVLVDVRDPIDFEVRHIPNAVNWPLAEILALGPGAVLPGAVRGKRLLLVCNSGISSAAAVRKLRDGSLSDAWNLQGGMGAYTVLGTKPCPAGMARSLFTGTGPAPERDLPLYEECALVATGFGVKPFYMLLSFVLILALWRASAVDLAALRWGMIAFLFGEGACAFNYAVFDLQSYFTDYLHSFGMLVSFSLVAFALFEGMDARIIKLSDPTGRCAALGLCESCLRRRGGPCGLERLFLWLIAACVILALMPLNSTPRMISYNTGVFGTPYNLSHAVVHQVFETRYCPILAAVFFTASFLFLALKKDNAVEFAKVAFAAGMGPFSFSLFRLILFRAYDDNLVWFDFWEEIAELIFIVAVAVVVWIFRDTLLPKLRQREASA